MKAPGLRNERATAMPRSDVQNASETSKSGSFSVSVDRLGNVEFVIESHGGPGIVSARERAPVQHGAIPTVWLPVLTEHAEADRAMRRLGRPFRIPELAASLESHWRARRAVNLFRAKGRLVECDDGRFWFSPAVLATFTRVA
jgi:hypothetical protein